ncbi:MAG TPA: hypothetical protein VF752_03620 [Thermoleophilaceae bacterium]
MDVLAAIRPDSWNFPLLVHLIGATTLVGALVLAGSALLFAWRDGNATLAMVGYRTMLLGVLPAWIIMRGGAQWIASKEHLEDSNASWVGIGFTTADAGLAVLVVATLLAWLAVRRTRREGGTPGGLGVASAFLVAVLVIAYLVAVWAMTTKPV